MLKYIILSLLAYALIVEVLYSLNATWQHYVGIIIAVSVSEWTYKQFYLYLKERGYFQRNKQ